MELVRVVYPGPAVSVEARNEHQFFPRFELELVPGVPKAIDAKLAGSLLAMGTVEHAPPEAPPAPEKHTTTPKVIAAHPDLPAGETK